MRDTRDRELNARDKAIRGLKYETTDMGKDLYKDQEKSGMDGATLTSPKSNVFRLTSEINGVR